MLGSRTGRAAWPWRLLETWRERSRERAQLAGLSLRELRDMGLSPGDAREEAGKPFWRP